MLPLTGLMYLTLGRLLGRPSSWNIFHGSAMDAHAMNKSLKYNQEQRREYLQMTDRIGMNWMKVFEGQAEFYSADYWDLLTGIWRAGGPVRKTDATRLMKGLKSAQTAGKYVEAAIKYRLLLERENPKDARSRVVELSPEMKLKLDEFFDLAVGELRRSHKFLQSKGPLPEEP